ncbi:double-headed protease inhibitor, submandibular gland-like [Monodelphis domestica]|uniref:double-headed protease inhibitor, submandibular gland-like n=1 Tax=Monodelphis domestica TaxID=13616 RepID=UPI00044320B9|nr:double-headed protease inhibitor, submandibular gland-like [Monodelphis domestica]
MMKSAALTILVLATSYFVFSVADNQVKVSQEKGTEVDCGQYFTSAKGMGCPRNYQPICGTNQKTYGNECMLCDFNRSTRMNIRKLHDGDCEK